MHPLVEELTPAPVAWDAFTRLAHLPHAIFFDSSLAHPQLGRYSFIAADPFEFLVAGGRQSSVDPLIVLADLMKRYPVATVPGLPPFQGGAAGLFGYDLAHHFERLPRAPLDEFEVPELAVGVYDWMLAFDHRAMRCWLVSTGLPETGEPGRRRAERRARDVKHWLAQE